MIKVEKEAGIHIRDALKRLGAGFYTTAQIRSTAERIRGKKIEYNIVIDFLSQLRADGVLQHESIPRQGKKGPYRDGSKNDKWHVINFESFVEKHNQSMDNDYVQELLS